MKCVSCCAALGARRRRDGCQCRSLTLEVSAPNGVAGRLRAVGAAGELAAVLLLVVEAAAAAAAAAVAVLWEISASLTKAAGAGAKSGVLGTVLGAESLETPEPGSAMLTGIAAGVVTCLEMFDLPTTGLT